MILNLIYTIFAALGLGLLIFIHEFGHYYMARRLGMKVDAFSIGFGQALFSWERDGVKWKIGWLPFGGYVKIAGMEADEEHDLYEIPGGFFSKKPLDRIKVAFAGPFVNLFFAFLLFTALWMSGGREKNFSEYTPKIGWVDPKSELYAFGVRPGDEIVQYDQHHFRGFKDHLYGAMTASDQIKVSGYKVDQTTGEKTAFNYQVKPYQHPLSLEKGILTAGVLNSASYIIYHSEVEASLPEGSPMKGSGIEPGDRLVWMDGQLLFSLQQLSQLLNDNKVLLTIQRGDQKLLKRIPRVKVEELKFDNDFKEELIDWQYEAQLAGIKIMQLYAIPYNLTSDCIVENSIRFIDKEVQEEVFPEHPFSEVEAPLEVGDKIIAVDGVAVKYAYQLFFQLQERKVNLIVQRGLHSQDDETWQEIDARFSQEIYYADLQKIVASIGAMVPVNSAGTLRLLKPVTPKMRSEFAQTPEKQAIISTELLEKKKELQAIEDPEKRTHALKVLESHERQLLLGLPGIQDRKVIYNPTPIALFKSVCDEIWRTMSALFSGYLNPKWLGGPIGMVQIVQSSWMIGMKEALFWIGAISLNLGILNLLPIPVLDGGYICLFLLEMITGKRIKPKALEKLIIPFAVLILGFLVYLTYNDLSRLIGGFFNW